MTVKRISPGEALSLMRAGHAYLDVRTVVEFEMGHPEGAYNIPWQLPASRGLVDNPDFLSQVASLFDVSAPLIVGCKMGIRSLAAAQALIASGYESVTELRPGFVGATDAFGQIVEPGWQREGLPVARRALPGRSFREVRELAR